MLAPGAAWRAPIAWTRRDDTRCQAMQTRPAQPLPPLRWPEVGTGYGSSVSQRRCTVGPVTPPVTTRAQIRAPAGKEYFPSLSLSLSDRSDALRFLRPTPPRPVVSSASCRVGRLIIITNSRPHGHARETQNNSPRARTVPVLDEARRGAGRCRLSSVRGRRPALFDGAIKIAFAGVVN